jgi:hypothetical protein
MHECDARWGVSTEKRRVVVRKGDGIDILKLVMGDLANGSGQSVVIVTTFQYLINGRGWSYNRS